MTIFDARRYTAIAPHGMRDDLASTEVLEHRPGERSCRLCHFLVKIDPEGETVHWDKSERENASLEDPWGAACSRGVWSAGIAPELRQHVTKIVKKQRSARECFFVQYAKGMSDSCAEDLERRRSDHVAMKRSNLYTQIALGISAVALIVTTVSLLLEGCG